MSKSNKDWTGNSVSTFKTLGASSHTKDDREENDFYATDPIAAKLLLELETLNKNIWEPSCGQGHLSEIFVQNGHNVKSSDLIDRGYGESGVDFLTYSNESDFFDGDIITNPPYKYAKEFVEKALQYVKPGNKVCMFLKVLFLESKSRRLFFEKNPIKTVYVSSSRIKCAINGDFSLTKEVTKTSLDKDGKTVTTTKIEKDGASAVAYAWFVWEKGYQGETTLKFFN